MWWVGFFFVEGWLRERMSEMQLNE
jgi:hypothetical protein